MSLNLGLGSNSGEKEICLSVADFPQTVSLKELCACSLYIAGKLKGGSPLIEEGHCIVTKQQIWRVNQITPNTAEKQVPS